MKCNICQTEKTLRPGGVSKSTGKPYPEFWSCPNFKDKQHQEAKNEWKQASDRYNPPAGTFKPTNEGTGFQVLTEHILSLEAKVDELIGLIKEQLSL